MGAEVILTPGAEGSNGAVRRAQPSSPPSTPSGASSTSTATTPIRAPTTRAPDRRSGATAPEITHFVAGLGTSGTLMGTGRFLKEQNPAIQIIAVEPPLGERVEGLRNMDEGYIPPVFENWHGFELLDRKRVVRPRESLEWTRRLRQRVRRVRRHLVGRGAGRRRQGRREIDEGTIVFIVCDGGWKYLSTGAYTADLDEAEANAEKIIYF